MISTITTKTILTVAAGAALLWVGTAHAVDPLLKCHWKRHVAAATYAACQQRTLGKFEGDVGPDNFDLYERRCTVKYAAAWPQLQVIGVNPCSGNRFEDNADGTVTDKLTGLVWEQKTDDATVHDKDNVYSWTAGPFGAHDADGTAFTSFLSTLNGVGCFAGQCDWRLPTQAELETIRTLFAVTPFACSGMPCIDPIFGPTQSDIYWSATLLAGAPLLAWEVDFADGKARFDYNPLNHYVRAVRGGL